MKKELAARYATLCVAFFLMAVGIALCIRANLGITPISCPPYVLSLGLAPTVGQFTIAMHVIFVLGQIIILRHDFHKIQLLQLGSAFVFGVFVDLAMYLTDWITVSGYAARMALLLASCLLIAVGVILQIKAHAVLLAGEGIMLAIAKKTRFDYAKVKMVFDTSLLLIGVAFSFFFFGGIEGIREGTVISALLVGFLVGIIQPHMHWVDSLLTRISR